MKARLLRIGCVSIALATGVACATSNEETQEPTNPSNPATDEAGTQLPDGPDADAGRDEDVVLPDGAVPTCSPEGWCATRMPDPETSFSAASVLDDAVFALTNNTSLGVKVMAWTEEKGWSYIDDGSQQSTVLFPRTLYAPSKDDVFVFMVDYSLLLGGSTLGGVVFHGKPPVGSAKTWTWTQQSFPCADFDEGWIGGSGPDGVYMAVCSTIYRFASTGEDGAADTWDPIYTDVDDPTHFQIRSISGTADDMWFFGNRNSLFTSAANCNFVIRKTADGFEKVFDATLGAADCTEKPGIQALDLSDGFYYSGVFSRQTGSALMYGHDEILRVAKNASGSYDTSTLKPNLLSATAVNWIWGLSNDDIFLIGAGSPGSSLLIRGDQISGANPKYDISSIAINGAPNLKNLNFVLGTSNTNMWVLGNETAYHKTTP